MVRIVRSGFVANIRSIYRPNWTVEITKDDGTKEDVSNDLIIATVRDSMNEVISDFEIVLDNKDGKNVDKWDGGELVVVYADFEEGTTPLIRGRIEKPQAVFDSQGRKFVVAGRNEGQELQEINIIEEYTNTLVEDIVADIISKYASRVTYNKISTGISISKISFRKVKAWTAIQNVLKTAKHDSFIDQNSVLQHFATGTRTNISESIIHGINMLSVVRSSDVTRVKNRISFIGGSAEENTDVLILRTKNDSSSQANYGVREETIEDSNVRTNAEADIKTQDELDRLKNLLVEGVSNAVGLKGLHPGVKIRISDPYSGVNGFYKVPEIIHTIGTQTGYVQSVRFERYDRTVADELQKLNNDADTSGDYKNSFGMTQSFVITFDESPSSMQHSGTVESQSFLVLSSGTSNGTATSIIHVADNNITEAEIRYEAEDISSSVFSVTNNGSDFVTATKGNKIVFTTTGNQLRFRINLIKDSDNTTPKVAAFGVLYKEG